MRILLINDTAQPLSGSELKTLDLRDELRRRGHDARVFSSRASRFDRSDRFGRSGQKNLAEYTCFGTETRFQTLLAMANPFAYFRLRQVLKEFRPDVVHVRTFLVQLSPLILPLLRRVPSIYNVVIYKAVCPMGTKLLPGGAACTLRAGKACLEHCLPLHAWLALMVQRKLFLRWRGAFRAVVSNSAMVRQALLEGGIGPSEVLWNGVPDAPPRPALSGRPTIGYAGRLTFQKGLDVLLQATALVARQIAGVRLVIAGEGPLLSVLRAWVARLRLDRNVEIAGHLLRPELERCLAGAWVQAVPSRGEAFGNVACEAMMRGTAVVASRVGGLSEVVQDGRTGLLVPSGDAGALAQALLSLLGEPARADRLGSQGRQFALEHFSMKAYGDRITQLYQRVLNSPPAAGASAAGAEAADGER
jgi:glycosyltransferase involved in cell wall biosynthesis